MFEKCSKKLTNNDFNDVENKLKFKLPDDLKKHYLQYNGGVSKYAFFYMEKYGCFTEVSRFDSFKYPFDNSKSMIIEDRYYYYKDRKIIPDIYLPFATDWGGNLFCLNNTNNDIVLIYMDLGDVVDENIRVLTNGFGSFLGKLEENGDD